MFVRFRERINDAREPGSISASRACVGRCHICKGQRLGPGFRVGTGCPERPRCRWRIGGELTPYRLLVSLNESRRVDGKIRQKHIADLGAIEGHFLPSFFGGMSPESAHAARGDLALWFKASIERRLAFWRRLDQRLAGLSNRIDADQVAMIRNSVQERIPLPTGEEVAQIEAWDAGEEVSRWHRLREGYQGVIEAERAAIADLAERIERARGGIAALQPVIGEIDDTIRTVQRSLAEGDISVGKKSAAIRAEVNASFGRLLAYRISKS